MSFRSIGEIAAGLVEKAQAKQAEVPEITRPSKAQRTPATASSQRQSMEDSVMTTADTSGATRTAPAPQDPLRADLNRQSKIAADLMAELRTDDAELAHDMIEGETGLLEALAAAIDEIDQCEIIAAGCKAKCEEIEKRKTRAELRAGRMRALIEQAMSIAELPTARLPIATLSLKTQQPKAVIRDESLIPAEFWEPQPPRLDKVKLNKAAKLGSIPGVEMTNGSVSLQVRRL